VKKKSNKIGFKKPFSVGDLRTTGAVDAAVVQFGTEKSFLYELLNLIEDSDPGTRMRAFDALEKVTRSKDCLLSQKQIEKIFELGFECEQQEVLWHWCQIIPRLTLTKIQIDDAFRRMNALRGSKSKIVWTFALQGMFDLALTNPSLKTQACLAIEEDIKKGPASVKARCRRIIKSSKQKIDRFSTNRKL